MTTDRDVVHQDLVAEGAGRPLVVVGNAAVTVTGVDGVHGHHGWAHW